MNKQFTFIPGHNQTIIVPSDLTYIPFDNTDLLYMRVQLTPENYNSFMDRPNLLRHIRMCHFTGIGASYPRFDPGSWPYRFHSAPEQLLITNLVNNPEFSDFGTITDRRVQELKIMAEKYEKIHLFYSGGIDSTTILCAMLKNWDPQTLSKLVLVMNQHSIDENPVMHIDYILGKFDTIATEDFYSRKHILTDDTVYTGGTGANQIFGYDEVPNLDEVFPGKYTKPWKNNIDTIIKYFSIRSGEMGDGMFTFETIKASLEKHRIEMDTVFDFMSWYSFNWAGVEPVYLLSVYFGHLDAGIDKKRWIRENSFSFFSSEDYQYWYLGTIGTDLRSGTTANMYKYAAKKYIYDFNHDKEYFVNKLKVPSVTAELIPEYKFAHKLYAIDTDYNFYYQQSPQTPWPKR